MKRSLFASVFFDVFPEIEFLLWRLMQGWAGFITSVKEAARLRVNPSARQEYPGWAARALNDRRLGGMTCHGDLLGPACRALVG
jgi:hypothetical protein